MRRRQGGERVRERGAGKEAGTEARRGERLRSAGGGSRASVEAAAPPRWWRSRGAAAPTRRPLRARARPTSQYRASPLVRLGVTQRRTGQWEAEGGLRGGSVCSGSLFHFLFFPSFFSSFFFFLFNKMSRRKGKGRG